MMRFPGRVVAALASVLFLYASGARASTFPQGFAEQTVVGGFVLPTAVEVAPDGRYFVSEKRGVIWVVTAAGVKNATPFIDLIAEVHDAGDKGLLGFALDPDFAANGYVYLLYSVDPVYGQPDEPIDDATFGRLTRYTAVGDTADPASRLVLLGNTAADGIAHCHESHGTADVAFGADGMLYVGAGDGSHYEYADGGQNITPADPDCEATFGSPQDVGALRSQSDVSLAGKLLRVDPATGLGLPDNPFYDGDPASFVSRIWAKGLRNPFRFTLRPGSTGPGTWFISDVGWNQYEEIDVSHGGENFGWPCYEGPGAQDLYQISPYTDSECQGLDAQDVTFPTLTWHRSDPGTLGFTGSTASGIAFYEASAFPAFYQGRLFFSDFSQGWIRTAVVDAFDQIGSITLFASGVASIVDLKVHPITGDLLYISIGAGQLRRFRWVNTPVPPVPVASANPQAGSAPLPVQFSSNGSYDPNGDPFTVSWNFGDGSPADTDPNPQHTYTTLGTFTARLTATDNTGRADSASVVVTTSNAPPTVSITNPPYGYIFGPSENIPLTADASDPEDGTNLTWLWQVQLIHNSHVHSGWFTSGVPSPVFTAQVHGEDGDRYSYRILVTVTDTDGATGSDTTAVLPYNEGLNQDPIAKIDASPYQGEAPLLVSFNATQSTDPDIDFLTYTWDFGDGTFDHAPFTTHIFGQEGLYQVVLTAQDPPLATARDTVTIRVDPAGLVARWDFDEGPDSLAYDGSGHGYHGVVQGGATWVTGVHGFGMHFDGVNDYVSTGQPLLSNRTAFTISVWINPLSQGSRRGLVGQNDAVEFGFIDAAHILCWSQFGPETSVPYGFPVNTWHHVAVTAGPQSVSFYYDGAPAVTNLDPTANFGSSAYGVNIGGGGIFDPFNNWFQGDMDQVRIYDRELTPAEVAFLAVMPPANAPPVVEAGADVFAVTDQIAMVHGTVYDDGLPAPPGQVTTLWTQLEGPGAAQFFNPDAVYSQVLFPASGSYLIALVADDDHLSAMDTLRVTVQDPIAGVDGEIPRPVLGIRGVVPNPLTSSTAIRFTVGQGGSMVTLRVLDTAGRLVNELHHGLLSGGDHELFWTGRDSRGRRVASGLYFISMETDGRRFARKITVLQ